MKSKPKAGFVIGSWGNESIRIIRRGFVVPLPGSSSHCGTSQSLPSYLMASHSWMAPPPEPIPTFRTSMGGRFGLRVINTTPHGRSYCNRTYIKTHSRAQRKAPDSPTSTYRRRQNHRQAFERRARPVMTIDHRDHPQCRATCGHPLPTARRRRSVPRFRPDRSSNPPR